MKPSFLIAFFTLLLLTSCNESAFFEYKIRYERKPSAIALIHLDSTATAKLSFAQAWTANPINVDTSHFASIRSTVFHIKKGSSIIDELVHRNFPSNNPFRTSTHLHFGQYSGFKPSELYRIEFSIDGKTYQASTMAQHTVPKLNYSVDLQHRLIRTDNTDSFSQASQVYQARINVSIPEMSQKTYFYMQFYVIEPDYNRLMNQTRPFETNLPINEDFVFYSQDRSNVSEIPIYFSMLYDNKLFENQAHELIIVFENRVISSWEPETFFIIYSVNEDYAKYLQTTFKSYNNSELPFAEPVSIFSNMEDGALGIFGVVQEVARIRVNN